MAFDSSGESFTTEDFCNACCDFYRSLCARFKATGFEYGACVYRGDDCGILLGGINGFGFRIDIFNIYGVIFVLSMSLYPYVYLLAKTAFKSESKAIYEVGKINGYSEFSIFYKVSIKLAMPSILAGLMLVLMEVLS